MFGKTALAALLASGFALAGCANDPFSTDAIALAGGPLAVMSPASANEPTSSARFSAEDPSMLGVRKTMAGKVLTAIALERVTGRKPDPARISEIY